MKEPPSRFAARPWTQEDDDNLRSFVIAGVNARAIRSTDEPNRNRGSLACCSAKDHAQKIETRPTPATVTSN
jgi:hypothetical protein